MWEGNLYTTLSGIFLMRRAMYLVRASNPMALRPSLDLSCLLTLILSLPECNLSEEALLERSQCPS